jgi:hypothetical protein
VTPEQVEEMGEYAHIYMTKDGRISMAGLNEHNIQVSCFTPRISRMKLTYLVLCREHVQMRQGRIEEQVVLVGRSTVVEEADQVKGNMMHDV